MDVAKPMQIKIHWNFYTENQLTPRMLTNTQRNKIILKNYSIFSNYRVCRQIFTYILTRTFVHVNYLHNHIDIYWQLYVDLSSHNTHCKLLEINDHMKPKLTKPLHRTIIR